MQRGTDAQVDGSVRGGRLWVSASHRRHKGDTDDSPFGSVLVIKRKTATTVDKEISKITPSPSLLVFSSVCPDSFQFAPTVLSHRVTSQRRQGGK